jgi:hypothetical protein
VSKDESKKYLRSAQQVEETATELVEAGDALFRDRAPADPTLLHRYQLYKRIQSALALPAGPMRVVALRAALIDRERKH